MKIQNFSILSIPIFVQAVFACRKKCVNEMLQN